jgi:hypothetical protein
MASCTYPASLQSYGRLGLYSMLTDVLAVTGVHAHLLPLLLLLTGR